jgi:hypothetical protein
MTLVYHTSSHTQSRTRATTHKPRRAYYVFKYLERQLTPGKARAISNAQIKEALRFGSEGEISQIMRWLAGEQPTAGRWAYKALNQEQVYRFIERERLPHGGYSITLLARPEPIAARAEPTPEVVQLSFLDDPLMIPPAPQQDAARRGSFSDLPASRPDRAHCNAADRRSQGDHPKESLEESDQEEGTRTPQKTLEADPLYQHLLSKPGMNRNLARTIAQHPLGSIADFEIELGIAETLGKTTPLFYTAALWRDGKHVEAPEERHHERSARGHATSGARTRTATTDARIRSAGATDSERGPIRTTLNY